MSYTNSKNTINETRRRKIYPRAYGGMLKEKEEEEPAFPERHEKFIHIFSTWINVSAVDAVVGVLYVFHWVTVDQLGKSIEFGIQWQFKD